jgi:DNA-binding response OmpR family regulator
MRDTACFVAKKVLVVDDDPATRNMVQFVLRRDGFDVKTADSGHAAIAQLQEESYDAVVLDLLMPCGAGSDVLQFIASQRPGVKCVVVVTAASTAQIENIDPANVLVTLRKPFDIHELTAAVKSCLEGGGADVAT